MDNSTKKDTRKKFEYNVNSRRFKISNFFPRFLSTIFSFCSRWYVSLVETASTNRFTRPSALYYIFRFVLLFGPGGIHFINLFLDKWRSVFNEKITRRDTFDETTKGFITRRRARYCSNRKILSGNRPGRWTHFDRWFSTKGDAVAGIRHRRRRRRRFVGSSSASSVVYARAMFAVARCLFVIAAAAAAATRCGDGVVVSNIRNPIVRR